MDLSNVYTGDCEIILYDNKWIYPIFKAGWTGLQRVKEDSRVNNEITGTAGNIFVHIRDPHKRFVGAINKYSQIHNKPISNPYKSHIKTISKPYQSHTKAITKP